MNTIKKLSKFNKIFIFLSVVTVLSVAAWYVLADAVTEFITQPIESTSANVTVKAGSDWQNMIYFSAQASSTDDYLEQVQFTINWGGGTFNGDEINSIALYRSDDDAMDPSEDTLVASKGAGSINYGSLTTFSWSATGTNNIFPAISTEYWFYLVFKTDSSSWSDNGVGADDQFTVSMAVGDVIIREATTPVDITSTGTPTTDNFIADNTAPTVDDFAVETNPICDSTTTQEVVVTFSEEMDSTATPTIAFATTTGFWTSNDDGAWNVGTTTWTETFTLDDQNEEVTGVSVLISDGVDVAGNSQGGTHEVAPAFDVDTENPTAVEVIAQIPTIFESQLTQTVQVVYDESMDTGTTPVITLTGTNWEAQTNVGWSTSTAPGDTFTATFTHDGDEETIAAETATVANASGATDLAGNDEIGDTSDPFVVDTGKPTVTGVTPTTLNRNEVGPAVTFTITFDEDMDQTSVIVATVEGLTASSSIPVAGDWTSTTTWGGTFALYDDDEEVDDAFYAIAGAQDVAGNVIAPLVVRGANNPLDVDTLEPTVTNVAVGTAIIYDTDLTQEVTLTFLEAMDVGIDPTIVFSNGTWTSAGAGVWASSTEYSESFDLTDNGETFTDVDIIVSEAEDLAGNAMFEDDSTGADAFNIDTQNPTATVNVGVPTIFESSLTQTVIVVYDEEMDPTATPTITVDGGVAWGPQVEVGWSATNTTYTATFLHPGDEEEIAVATATVSSTSGAKDLAGNTDIGNTANFEIDTQKPTGTVAVDTDPVYDTDLIQIVTITYDEEMDGASTPVITFDGNTGAIATAGDGAWDAGTTTWTETFNVTDAEEETPAVTASSTGAAIDAAGNAEGECVSTTFEIDTIAPTITDVNSDKADDDYTIGEVIDIDVTFSENVTSAEITVTLDTGGSCITTAAATDTVTCDYTVGEGENSADLDVANIAGVIADAAGNLVIDFVPATNLIANKDIVIDTTAPAVDAGESPGTVYAEFNQDATASDDGSGIATYAWTKVSGPYGVTFTTADIEDPDVSAAGPGAYEIMLTVTDNTGNSATDTVAFTWSWLNVPIWAYSPLGSGVAIADGTATITFGDSEDSTTTITLLDANKVNLVDNASGISMKTGVEVRDGDGNSKYLDISYSGLEADKTYRINILSGAVKNDVGNINSDDISYFSTGNGDITPPEVEDVYPADGAEDVNVFYAPIQIFFNEGMDVTTIINDNIKLYNDADEEIVLDPDYGVTALSGIAFGGVYKTYVEIVPATILDASTTYYVTISTDVTDLAGNPFDGWIKGNYSFTTAETPTGELNIDNVRINPLRTYALATDDYDDGWEWWISLTIPTDEPLVQLKFSDFFGPSDQIAAADNIRYFSERSTDVNSTTTAITVEGANDYGEDSMTFDVDSDTQLGMDGWQIVVTVQVKVPTTADGGAYSAQFSVQSSEEEL